MMMRRISLSDVSAFCRNRRTPVPGFHNWQTVWSVYYLLAIANMAYGSHLLQDLSTQCGRLKHVTL